MTNNTKSLSLDEEIAEFQRDTHPFREICKYERCDSIPDNWKLIDKLITDRARLLAEVERLKSIKDGAYKERNVLVSALSKLFPSWLRRHEGGEWEDDWRWIVFIQLPTGQCSWHIHDSEFQLFSHIQPGLEEWDGHDNALKYSRVIELKSNKGE